MPHNPPYSSVDEKAARRRSIPAQIVLWTVVAGLLYAFWVAFGGRIL